MAPTYPSASATETFAGRKRYFRGRSGFLGSSTRAGHYGFFGPQTGTSGGGSNFFDPWARPQPVPRPREFRPLIHRGRVFGKRMGVSLVAEYERGLAWRRWAARVGRVAIVAGEFSPVVDAVLVGWSLYQSYTAQPDRTFATQWAAAGFSLCCSSGNTGRGGYKTLGGSQDAGKNPCGLGVTCPVPYIS